LWTTGTHADTLRAGECDARRPRSTRLQHRWSTRTPIIIVIIVIVIIVVIVVVFFVVVIGSRHSADGR
jgi:t-SNARE complex subunit (syntaxin)